MTCGCAMFWSRLPTATVVLRADGSVAEVLPRSFASADEIAAVVDPKIGVPG